MQKALQAEEETLRALWNRAEQGFARAKGEAEAAYQQARRDVNRAERARRTAALASATRYSSSRRSGGGSSGSFGGSSGGGFGGGGSSGGGW